MEIQLPSWRKVVLTLFFVMNVLMFLMTVVGVTHIVSSMWRDYTRHALSKGGPRLVSPIGVGCRRSRSLFARGLSKKQVMKFRTLLTPKRVGHALVKPGLDAIAHDRKTLLELTDKLMPDIEDSDSDERKEDDESLNNISSLKAEKSRVKYSKKNDTLQWGQDPLVYFSAVTSKFASEYTPLHARRAWTSGQMNGQLIMPHPISSGSAFVLPTGHIINKSFGMTKRDLKAHNPPNPRVDSDLQPSCTVAPRVTRTNLYGYAGSKKNLKAFQMNATETLLCPCKMHRHLLDEPDASTYALDPMTVEIHLRKKQALLPGPGIAPITSTQPTTVSAGNQDHHETTIEKRWNSQDKELEIIDADSLVVPTVPIYGAGLVNLPVTGLPLAVNCICTDRPDGKYRVSRPPIASNAKSETSSQADGVLEEMTVNNPSLDQGGGIILYRHLASYLNSNSLKAAHLHSKFQGYWAIDGAPISSIKCKDEQVVQLQ
uniref:Wsv325-like protein n=1 Tax=Melicertus latisulcatus pemonivirus TaxID=2984278 RepID=A0A9C7C8I5_9VIRU|nr:MAG: wsv325-like protein [Melicertus latisulcatus pemonivirus]